MSRFDRRLRGTGVGNDGPRPGTASCSLPASSTPDSTLLGGNFINNRSTSTRNMSRRQINGVAMLQNHEQKIIKLEKKISGVELGMNINISRQESETKQLQTQLDMLNSQYNEQMQVLKDHVRVLEEKIIKTSSTEENTQQSSGNLVKNINLVILEDN